MTKVRPSLGSARTAQSIPLSQIDLGDRLRVVANDHVRMLAESIREIGQTTPIEVRPIDGGRFKLVAGGHRYVAVGLVGHSEIEAFVVEIDELQARLREIDENLYRHELNPFDRGRFLTERKTIWQALHPESKRGGDRGNQHTGGKPRQTDTMSVWQTSTNDIVSFAEKTALAAGYTARTIRRSIGMYERLAPAARSRLGGSPLAKDQSQLIALSRLPPADQVKALDLVERSETPLKVKAAIAQLAGKPAKAASADDKGYQRLLDAWGRGGKRARRQFLATLHERGDLDELLGGRLAGDKLEGAA